MTFAELGGFKLLAVARLSPGAYSIVCYLLNSLVAGIEEVLSSPGELSVLLGISEKDVKQALEELEASKIISLTSGSGKTLVMRLGLEIGQWENLRRPVQARRKRATLGDAKNIRALHPQTSSTEKEKPHSVPNERPGGVTGITPVGGTGFTPSPAGQAGASSNGRSKHGHSPLSSHEALVFPAKRATPSQPPQLTALDGGKHGASARGGIHSHDELLQKDADKVYDAFKSNHRGNHNPDKEKSYALLLVESHPAEQVMSLILHFGGEIPSLGMLAGAWLHYSEKFNHTHTEVNDFEAYRKKHRAAEKKLRMLAQAELKRSQAHKLLLNADEELLLHIFVRHQQPRRQLYWALQARDRYPHLQDFFASLSDIALPPEPHKKPLLGGPHKTV